MKWTPRKDESMILRVVILIAIAIGDGPEIFAALELQALLELLGAALFLTAFHYGARLAARQLICGAVNLLLSEALVSVLRGRAPPLPKGLAAARIRGW